MAEIAKLDDETERTIKWSLYYYEKWHELPNQQQQSALEKFWDHPNIKTVDELISNEDGYKKLVAAGGKQAASKVMVDNLNRLVAQEIVKASYGGVKTAAGRRGAVFIAEESAKLAAARGANVAMTGVRAIASLPVGITAAIGEMVGDAIASTAGVTNHHAKNALGAGGAMAGGAAAGAFVGGPIGAAAGAAVGAGSWAVGQGIKALMNVGKGPDDNWCYIEIGYIGDNEICVGTYAASDTMYWKTYWNEYKRSNSDWVMSAGQSETGSFQLCIWHDDRVIKHFNHVYYRDMFGIIKRGHTFRVVHCRGQYHPTDSGKVSLYEN